jgi:quinol monooxygenase YgiN
LLDLDLAHHHCMRGAEGCEFFDLLRDEEQSRTFVFLPGWDSHQAHDTAFAERIVRTGHLDKVFAAIDQPIVQHTYKIA